MIDADLRRQLLELIPVLGEQSFEHTDAPLRSVLSHSQFQAVVLAVQRLAPHLDRAAFENGASWDDVAYWLACAPPPAPVRRGVYRSPAVALRPLLPRDLDGFYLASLEPEMNHRWRFRGRTPSLAEFQAEMMGEHVLAQYVVTTSTSDAAVGLVVGYAPDLVARHCRLAVQRSAHAPPDTRGLMMEGTLRFVQYLFDHFDLRKIYFEIPEYNRNLLVGGLDDLVVEEGRFVGHQFHGDRHWDLVTFAIYRERWDEVTVGISGDWPEDSIHASSGT